MKKKLVSMIFMISMLVGMLAPLSVKAAAHEHSWVEHKVIHTISEGWTEYIPYPEMEPMNFIIIPYTGTPDYAEFYKKNVAEGVPVHLYEERVFCACGYDYTEAYHQTDSFFEWVVSDANPHRDCPTSDEYYKENVLKDIYEWPDQEIYHEPVIEEYVDCVYCSACGAFKSGSYTGILPFDSGWYYVRDGAVNFKANGLYQYGGNWWYVQNGKVNLNATGLCQYGNGWYYVQNGAVNFKATGLCQYGSGWYYVQNGAVNFKATGLCKYGNGWYYVQNGAVNFKATGLCQYESSWYYVQNGAVNFKVTGLCQYGKDWWYVQSGAVNFNYNGRVLYGNRQYHVTNGKVVF